MSDEAKNEAYEADLRLRRGKDEELKATSDYLSVIMKEIEQRNEELENIKRETEAMKSELERAYSDVSSRKKNEASARKGSAILAGIAIIEAIAIIALVVILVFKVGSQKDIVPQQPISSSDDSAVQITEAVVPEQDEDEKAPSVKYVEDLQARAEEINNLQNRFVCSVEVVDGYEYLLLSGGDADVLFRNEYSDENDIYKKSVIVRNDDKKNTFAYSYNLAEDFEDFAPFEVETEDDRCMVFVDGATADSVGSVPESVIFVNGRTMEISRIDDVSSKLREQLYYEVSGTESFSGEDYILIDVGMGEQVRTYAVTAALYHEMEYFEEEMPALDNGFMINYKGGKLSFFTAVSFTEDRHFGRLSFELAPLGGIVDFKDLSYEPLGESFTLRQSAENPVQGPVNDTDTIVDGDEVVPDEQTKGQEEEGIFSLSFVY